LTTTFDNPRLQGDPIRLCCIGAAAPGGFRRVGWDDALTRVVGEIRRIQEAHGDDAFAMLSGRSPTRRAT
jgi:predicted molibdopterin-dependent oxidoreductase YjgC